MKSWLFDLYARGSSMVLWFLTDDGKRVRVEDEFCPIVYLDGDGRSVRGCLRAIEKSGDAELLDWTERRDFWTGDMRRVFALRVREAETWRFKLQRYADRYPLVSWYNADLMPEQLYCYERAIFPLCRCEFEARDGTLAALRLEDDRWDTRYDAPPLRTVEIRAEGRLLGRRPRLESITLEHDGIEMTWDDPATMLESFQDAIDRIDPDVLMTNGGDGFVFPLLLSAARQMRFPLRLDREPPPRERKAQIDGRSFMSYGRILYQAPEYTLYGRWHLDRDNSFMVEHTNLEGLYEVTRLSRLPPQRIARRSIGTGITSVQLDVAYHEQYLIPWKKTQPEAWKSASQLLKTDRGGLVYAPEIGFYENVVELDFMSMYPTIMSRFNVSPETVNCSCCQNVRVPEIGYTICERRVGLVSRALAPLIDKRVEYKQLRGDARERADEFDAQRFDDRQNAIKWLLVCCFGYLGYRNARFGRIEAHESVSAFSRELLTVAREVCEDRGWHMLHANVDCVWIVKPDFKREEIAELQREIDAATGLTISLEGVYRWIAFLPSRQFADRPVPTRYFGAFEDGSLKFRGIECRRRDLPIFIRSAQKVLLDELSAARTAEEYRAMIPSIRERVAEWEGMLWRGEIPIDKLAVRGNLSHEPTEYKGNGRQALAARQSERAGLNMHAGETIEYIITDAQNADRERRVCLTPLMNAETTYDPVAYIELLRRAVNTLLWPADEELLEKNIHPPWEKPAPPPKQKDRQLDFLEELG
ncbi:hypothetical protein KQI84_07020 [bacterium]|nr:hypothetical protein [bacterium]